MLILSRWKRPPTTAGLAGPRRCPVVLLLLVFTPLGESVGGNRNWITLPGGTSLQPSEVAKLGMCLWMAAVLAAKERLLGNWRHLVVPVVVPGAILIVGPVLAGNDLGTAMILMLIIAGGLFFAGAPMKLFRHRRSGRCRAGAAAGGGQPQPDGPHPDVDRPGL